MARYARTGVSEEVFKIGEKAISLFIVLSQCVSMSQALAAIHLFVSDLMSQSVTTTVMECIGDIFGPQSDGCEQPQWLVLLREVRDDWTKCVTSNAFKYLSKVLGLLVTAGLCEKSKVTFSIGAFRILEPEICKEHTNAIDLVDAVFKTVVYFAETGYACFATKSFRPLLMNSSELMELDTEYSNICTWWDLVKNGNLEKVMKVTDAEFDRRLGLLTSRVTGLLPSLTGFERKLCAEKHMRLLQMRNDYVTMKLSCGIRKAPFVIKLFGKSSQGKTTYGEQLIQALLVSAGLPTERDYRVNYNVADKYMSTMKTNCVVMTLDDFANTKAEFMDQSPTQVLINVCNNQPCYANMADLAQKGKVFIEPRIVLINTNKENLDAGTYSNCPYSIQRRPNIDIELEAKREFQLIVDGIPSGVDPEKVAKWNLENDKQANFDDIWNITIKKAVEPSSLSNIASYSVVKYKGKPLENIGFAEALEYIIGMYHKHDAAQNAILDKTVNLSENMRVCGVDGCKNIHGVCSVHCMDCQVGIEDVTRVWSSVRRTVADEFAMIAAHDARWAWLNRVPDFGLSNVYSRLQNYMSNMYSFIVLTAMNATACAAGSGVAWIMGFFWSQYLIPFIVYWGLVQQKHIYNMFRDTQIGRFIRTVSFTQICNVQRTRIAKAVISGCAFVASIYVIASIYRTWSAIKTQGALEPKTAKDVDERAAEDNVWTKVVLRPLPASHKQQVITPEQMKNNIDKNLTYVSIVGVNGKTLKANALFLRTGLVVIPTHYFKESGGNDIVCTFRKKNPDCAGGKFQAILSRDASYELEGRDLSICYVASGGSYKDITDYLPRSEIVGHAFELMYRTILGDIWSAKGLAVVKLTSNGTDARFLGSVYNNLTQNTFGGLCGAVQYSTGKQCMITGIHLGGVANTPRGCSGPIYFKDVENALPIIKQHPIVVLGGEDGVFERQVYGVEVTNQDKLDRRDPVNFMPEKSQIEYFGGCPGRAKPRSSVKVTPISFDVADVCGVPNIYRGPVLRPSWYGWQTCISNIANPARMFKPNVLAKAVLDYKSVLLPLFTQHDVFGHLRPLNDVENTNGIPGVQFIDSINMSTSKGFPLTGPKRDIVSPIEDENYPDGVKFDDFVLEHVEECVARYKKGERCHHIIKGCVKDEILAKDKCRIFYGNPLALTFLIRRYFLPIIRVLQLNPIKSECAVGVNCFGPEWEQLYTNVVKFGEDRIIGGDYGKYDQKVPSQLVLAALRVLIDLARQAGYDEEDLQIMEAMSADIAFAKIAFNGSLIGVLEGMHISGNSLTAVLNGIMGSLNARVYYFDSSEERPAFRTNVSLMTYGDDNIGSVNKDCDYYTMRGMSAYLATYGQEYTHPDKESEMTDFLPVEQFEFLKRFNSYIPEIECSVGALVEKSIFKSLHCFMRPKGSPLTESEACAQNLDTALREFFNHGREVYELRRAQFIEIARRNGIAHLCTRLGVTFDQHADEWKETYLGVKQERAEERFSPQSGVEYDQIIESIPFKLVGKDVQLFDSKYGDIDLLFEVFLDTRWFIVLVEVKNSSNKAVVKKGKSQVIKYSKVLNTLRPDATICGMLVAGKVVKLVTKNRPDRELWKSYFHAHNVYLATLLNDEPFMYI